MDFQQRYLHEEMKPSIALQIWVEYQYLTETYDRGVCSGVSPMTGDAIPKNYYERSLINQFAGQFIHPMHHLRKYYQITDDEWQRAKSESSRYRYERLKEVYDRLDFRDLTNWYEDERKRRTEEHENERKKKAKGTTEKPDLNPFARP